LPKRTFFNVEIFADSFAIFSLDPGLLPKRHDFFPALGFCCILADMLKEGDAVPGSLTGLVVVQTPHGFLEKDETLENLFKKNTVLLYFYPKDMTPGCITEAVGFQAWLPEFKKLGVRVIGCSRDTVKSHCGFIEKKSLAFELISDTSGAITEAFGVWAEKSMYGKKFMGILRSSFLIEKGKVVKVYPKVSVKTHAEEVLEFLKNR